MMPFQGDIIQDWLRLSQGVALGWVILPLRGRCQRSFGGLAYITFERRAPKEQNNLARGNAPEIKMTKTIESPEGAE